MKDINYALMLIKAHKFEGAKDVLEELHQGDPANKDTVLREDDLPKLNVPGAKGAVKQVVYCMIPQFFTK